MQTLNVSDYFFLEFLYVLVSRLLQLLTYSELSTLHETANNTLLILLDLCKMQNPKIYQELLGKFIDLYVGKCCLFLGCFIALNAFSI